MCAKICKQGISQDTQQEMRPRPNLALPDSRPPYGQIHRSSACCEMQNNLLHNGTDAHNHLNQNASRDEQSHIFHQDASRVQSNHLDSISEMNALSQTSVLVGTVFR
ncbi:hypothetical protein COP2_031231 [Malus domestica]